MSNIHNSTLNTKIAFRKKEENNELPTQNSVWGNAPLTAQQTSLEYLCLCICSCSVRLATG